MTQNSSGGSQARKEECVSHVIAARQERGDVPECSMNARSGTILLYGITDLRQTEHVSLPASRYDQ